jgi:hypothetical protein
MQYRTVASLLNAFKDNDDFYVKDTKNVVYRVGDWYNSDRLCRGM